jgi:hypothetical protein
MRKLLVDPWALLAILCLAIEAAAPLSAEVPPGPKWLETAVFYQIYPQSFFDSNGDGIGDLPGITAKLDYIQSVGCNAIWINPIYESPFGDAGYDVADFFKVAPRYAISRRTQPFGSVFAELLPVSTGPELRLCPARSERALATSDHRSRLHRGARGTLKSNEILAGLGC